LFYAPELARCFAVQIEPRGGSIMAKISRGGTAGGGPLMTLLALLILLMPVLALGGWLKFTDEGKASLADARAGVIANP